MRQLIFVHGRAQEHKDAAALKREWLETNGIGGYASSTISVMTRSSYRWRPAWFSHSEAIPADSVAA